MGMCPASASSRDTLLLERERSRGRRSLKPRGRPGGEKEEGRWKVRLNSCRTTGGLPILNCGREESRRVKGKYQRDKQVEIECGRIF